MSRQDDQSSSQPTTSLQKSENSMKDQPISEYAMARARLMFGCYRKGDANDPDTYVAAVALVLSGYPGEVITAITDPTNGLPSKSTWMPSVAEVKAACEEYIRPERDHNARQKRIAEQLSEREKDIELSRSRGERPTYEQLVAKLPSSLRLKKDTPPEWILPKDKFIEKYNVTPEQLDAVPNSKDYHWDKPALNIPEEPNPFEK